MALKQLGSRIKKKLFGAPVVPRAKQNQTIIYQEKLLKGMHVLVTGAGRNIGKAIALECAQHGANVYCTDINSESLAALERELKESNFTGRVFQSDVTNDEETDQLLQKLDSEDVKIDVLINNAAGVFDANKGFDPSLFRKTFDLNFFGPTYLTHQITQRMIRDSKPGTVIFITSIHQWSVNRAPAYSASKGAVGMLLKELAIEFAPHNIRVNGIAPGWVAEKLTGDYKYAPLHQSAIEPCYIARACVFLASEYFSRYTTGTVLTVDAGTLLYNHRVDQNPPEP